MSRPYWGCYYISPTGNYELCEVDGDTCYEAHRTREEADQSARWANEMYCEGQLSRYAALPIPPGIKVFDREDEVATLSGEHA